MSARKSKSRLDPVKSSCKPLKGKQKGGKKKPSHHDNNLSHLKRLNNKLDPKKLKKKFDKGFKPVAKIPSSREDSSSNWKALLLKQGKPLPISSSSAATSDSKKRRMDDSKETGSKKGSLSTGSREDTDNESSGRSRSVSSVSARCGSQLSMSSESSTSSSASSSVNLDDRDSNGNLADDESSQKVKQEFRALGLSPSPGPPKERQSRLSAKSPRGQGSHVSRFMMMEKKLLKNCLPDGLNEFGFFDYSHYGAIRTVLTPAHEEYIQDTVIISMDCEMVGVGPMKESALARVSIVNTSGFCLLDRFVKPKLEVTDYRTEFSGIREADLRNAHPLQAVQAEVSQLLRSHILVGHSLKSDLAVLFINHPKARMRDTAFFFKKMLHSRTPKLKTLVKKLLNVEIQQGEHSSITDAQAAMALYLMYQKEWETAVRQSCRGIDVLKECTEEFMKQKNKEVAPMLPAIQPQPSIPHHAPVDNNWYGFPAENSFSDPTFPELFSSSVGIEAMPIPYPCGGMSPSPGPDMQQFLPYPPTFVGGPPMPALKVFPYHPETYCGPVNINYYPLQPPSMMPVHLPPPPPPQIPMHMPMMPYCGYPDMMGMGMPMSQPQPPPQIPFYPNPQNVCVMRSPLRIVPILPPQNQVSNAHLSNDDDPMMKYLLWHFPLQNLIG